MGKKIIFYHLSETPKALVSNFLEGRKKEVQNFGHISFTVENLEGIQKAIECLDSTVSFIDIKNTLVEQAEEMEKNKENISGIFSEISRTKAENYRQVAQMVCSLEACQKHEDIFDSLEKKGFFDNLRRKEKE